jgi:hypothetical protein
MFSEGGQDDRTCRERRLSGVEVVLQFTDGREAALRLSDPD